MSLVCQSCGTEYGDPEFGEIPIICSECFEDCMPEDGGPESIDSGPDDQDFGDFE